jgi:hypothetical protein
MRDVCMLGIAHDDERGPAQDDEDPHGGVEVLVRESGRGWLHDQGPLCDYESEAE